MGVSAVESAILRVADITRPLPFDRSRPLEVEVGCGKGKFLTSLAAANPDCDYLGIERMLERVRLFDGKCRRGGIANAKVLRLEALYTFHYLLPAHGIRRVYVFFPDPWPNMNPKACMIAMTGKTIPTAAVAGVAFPGIRLTK